MVRSFNRLLVCAALACTLVGLALASGASGASGAATKKGCGRSAARFMVITNLSNNQPGAQISPDIVAGYRAAAAAMSKSCELNRPVKIVACDDQNTPNGDAACGRAAVADKVSGVFGYAAAGDSYAAPVTAAKIPILPFTASSASESTSPLSFPFGNPIPVILGQMDGLAAEGSKHVAILYLDVPAVQFFVNLLEHQASLVGVKIAATIPVPVTASDMSTYVAQAVAAGADGLVSVVAPSALTTIFKDAVAQGKNPKTFHMVAGANVMNPQALHSLPQSVSNGMLVAGWSLNPRSPSDTSTAPVKQYLQELAAAKQSGSSLVTADGLAAWGEMHAIADALKAKHMAPTAANVPKALVRANMPAITQKYGLVPSSFKTTAFPTTPALKGLRIFSKYVLFYRINAKGKSIRLTPHPVSVLSKPTFK